LKYRSPARLRRVDCARLYFHVIYINRLCFEFFSYS
jgi:hypothetical protein